MNENVLNDLVDGIVRGEITQDTLEEKKRQICGKYSAESFPSNPDILWHAAEENREDVRTVVQRKPVRTASGVSPVAIMTSPHMCPHGKCLYCPGGPASEFSSSQSYTGDGPAAARAKQNDYDPYGQVRLRLEQLRYIGHPVDKIDLILMGGTMTARSHDYQEWFVRRALQAMNDYDCSKEPSPDEVSTFAPESSEFRYVEDVKSENESNDIRCIGITFETKPDWCGKEQINRMLRLGATKVEIGVQTTYERINREMHRGHGIRASKDANKRLRDQGFKVGFHMMPGQPGMSQEMCVEDFRRIFSNSDWKPDYLKIYPTLVVPGTRVYDMWDSNDFEPLTSEEAAELAAEVQRKYVPKYCRVQRVQRDIPANHIEAGVQKSNLRQISEQRIADSDGQCECIRCREVGLQDTTPSSVSLNVMTYESCNGTEHFISINGNNDELIGFCRLRFPDSPMRPELEDAAIVRELHVYGTEATLDSSEEWQHQGYGSQLMNKAEALTKSAEYDKLSVISGIGARQYYVQKHDYHRDGPYVSKLL